MVLLQDKQQNIELISWLIQFFDIIENQPIFLDAICESISRLRVGACFLPSTKGCNNKTARFEHF